MTCSMYSPATLLVGVAKFPDVIVYLPMRESAGGPYSNQLALNSAPAENSIRHLGRLHQSVQKAHLAASLFASIQPALPQETIRDGVPRCAVHAACAEECDPPVKG